MKGEEKEECKGARMEEKEGEGGEGVSTPKEQDEEEGE